MNARSFPTAVTGCTTRRRFLRLASLSLPSLCLYGRRAEAALASVGPAAPPDLRFLERQVPLVHRAEWADAIPTPSKLHLSGGFDRLTVHHSGAGPNYRTARADVMRDMEGVFVTHVQRSYGDIGYHFVLDYAGTVWEGRSLAYQGAHVFDHNERNLGVMLLGNFEEQEPSVAQKENLTRLILLLRQRYRIKAHRVFGHRDLGYSACPGAHLYGLVRKMRE